MEATVQTTRAIADLDPLKAASQNYVLLIENRHVRVYRIIIKPGEKVAMHSNGASVIYVFNDGRIKHTYPDGTIRETEAVAGTVVWDEAETHETENVGTTDIHSLKVELKV